MEELQFWGEVEGNHEPTACHKLVRKQMTEKRRDIGQRESKRGIERQRGNRKGDGTEETRGGRRDLERERRGNPLEVVRETTRAGPKGWEPWKGRKQAKAGGKQGRRSGLQGRVESRRGRVGRRRREEEGAEIKGATAARPGAERQARGREAEI